MKFLLPYPPVNRADHLISRFVLIFAAMLFTGCEEDGASPDDTGQADPPEAADPSPVDAWDSATNTDLTWRFLAAELDHIRKGRFWTGDWQVANRHGTNPVKAITAYHEELGALGVRLLVVPVPPKAAVYPDQLPEDVPMPEPVDEFYDLLRAEGVEVVDLLPGLQVERVESEDQLYCKTDSHWSPSTGIRAARTVAQLLAEEPWAEELVDADRFEVQAEEVLAFHGDLLSDDEKTPEMLEHLPVEKVFGPGQPGNAVAHDPESPVLVIGDSHAMVFSTGGDMHGTAAGFVDHLQAALGFAVDVSANRGSGIGAARGSVTRRASQNPTFWDGKEVVIWLFAGREFTQGRWMEIPAVVD